MLKFRVYFDPFDYKRVMAAIPRTSSAVFRRSSIIGRQMGGDYVRLVALNIMSSKYAGGYAAYSEQYAKWKAEHTPGSPFWYLIGDLLQSLSVWHVGGDSWVGGIPPGVLDSGGKNYSGKGPRKYIAAYARIMEWGGQFKGQTHPARPMFTPTLKEYKTEGALKRLKEAKTVIIRSWR